MSSLVVDCSVAVKWFLNEPHSERARAVLNAGHSLLAPDLLVAESGNVMWKRTRAGEMTEQEAASVVGALLQMPVHLRPAGELVLPALEIANRMSRTVYDGLYVALAVAESTQLLTADTRLFNALQATPLASHLLWIEDL